jgi:hypothetical protein
MTPYRPLSEWQADLSTYQAHADKRLRWMKIAAIVLKFQHSRKDRRASRRHIKQMYREYIDLCSRVRLCESAISFHEAMLNHRP